MNSTRGRPKGRRLRFFAFALLFAGACLTPPAFSRDAVAPSGERPENKEQPVSDGDELASRARGLFDAIVRDDPSLAEAFWFPEGPFVELKAIDDPGKYWAQLRRTYARDVHVLHQRRKSWEGAKFLRFAIGQTPKWVEPGKEANSIGYYRSFHGKIHYEIDGKAKSVDIHTLITWQGRWYVTHLQPFR